MTHSPDIAQTGQDHFKARLAVFMVALLIGFVCTAPQATLAQEQTGGSQEATTAPADPAAKQPGGAANEENDAAKQIDLEALRAAQEDLARRRLQLRRSPVVQVFEAAKSAVVNISSTRIVEVRHANDALYRLFDLPKPSRRKVKSTSVGSGFVIHKDGYIVTNAHVVARTAERTAIFSDGSEHPAQLIAIDTSRDLAVLKIDTDEPLPTLPLGTSSDLMVGETVIAIGNPLGFSHTVTAGVVSATERSLEANDDLHFEGLIQTDASINPGNSGGPLLNVLGQLVGINTAIRADAQNIGFAIPVDQLRELLPELLDIERRYRIVTGLEISPTGPATVTAIAPDSPAAGIGLKVGDILTHLDDTPIRNAIDFHIALIGHKPGDRIAIRLIRGKNTGNGTLTLGERPRPNGKKLLEQRFGITASVMTEKMAKAMSLPGLSGLLVDAVDPGSPADNIGIQRGDLLVQIGRYQPKTLEDVGELLENSKTGQPVDLAILRITGNTIHRATVRVKAR